MLRTTDPSGLGEAERAAWCAAPTHPIDWEAVANTLHILEQGLATASLAHGTLLTLLGLEEQSAPILPMTTQTV